MLHYIPSIFFSLSLQEEDPFKESLDTEVHIGTVQVNLQPIAYNVELKEQLEITNYKGVDVGLMNVSA